MSDIHNLPDSTVQKNLSCPATYQVEGKMFIVEPIFQSEGQETIGTVLLKLIQSDMNTE